MSEHKIERKFFPVLDSMLKSGVEITRANYIDHLGFDNFPDPWTGEHETLVPPSLRVPIPEGGLSPKQVS